MMTQGENRCIFCDQLHMEGIHLRGKFICKQCEEEILKIKVDEPAYHTYKDGLKIIWTGQIPSDESDKILPDSPESDHV